MKQFLVPFPDASLAVRRALVACIEDAGIAMVCMESLLLLNIVSFYCSETLVSKASYLVEYLLGF